MRIAGCARGRMRVAGIFMGHGFSRAEGGE